MSLQYEPSSEPFIFLRSGCHEIENCTDMSRPESCPWKQEWEDGDEDEEQESEGDSAGSGV